jgi:hypothetical protein
MIPFSWRKETIFHVQIAPKSFAAAMKIEKQLYRNCSLAQRAPEGQGDGV